MTLEVGGDAEGGWGWIAGLPDDLDDLASAIRGGTEAGPVSVIGDEQQKLLTIHLGAGRADISGSVEHRERLAQSLSNVAQAARESGESRHIDVMPDTTEWLDPSCPEVEFRARR